MLQLNNITKIYGQKGEEQVEALKGISLEFRKSEFVSILGQSGCGKTTLLNIIGGLDKYTKGDLVINGKSTKEFKDRDWDTYRNHSVGFVFQSYNLIMHQSILNNVELALTLAGMNKAERRKKAIDTLETVGLKDKIYKKPTELSGGQMQRVAIARALIGDPDILLADEPTGALDSNTSIQIMDLLKTISKDRLVVMVTHNPELAKQYSTRIIKLLDGKVTDDSNPYIASNEEIENERNITIKIRKTYMKFITALSLSFKNLLTKKGRTILTAFAGSIGIIGIALIMSLSNGVQEYIDRVQRETLSAYPITIDASTIDLTSMIESQQELQDTSKNIEEKIPDAGKLLSKDNITNDVSLNMKSSMIENNLSEFKKYIDENNKNFSEHVSAIQYIYDVIPQIYYPDTSNGIIALNPNPVTLTGSKEIDDMTSTTQQNGFNVNVTEINGNNVFKELINSEELLNSQYEIVAGKLPENYNELVLIVDKNNNISDSVLYALNMKDRDELQKIVDKVLEGEKLEIQSTSYNYSDFIGKKFKLVIKSDYYVKEEGKWKDKSEDILHLKDLVANGVDLEIVGILKVDSEATTARSGMIGYTHTLSEYIINKAYESEIVKEQLANQEIDIVTELDFDIDSYIDTLTVNEIQGYIAEQYGLQQAKMMVNSMSEKELKEMIKTELSKISSNLTLEDSLKSLGYVPLDNPVEINIYPKDFSAKEEITKVIEDYNQEKINNNQQEYTISYTDYVALMISSVTTIIDTISYILIAFVAISLIVSSIMIAIITYISVLERTKEIGILRSIGASKKDVSRVFNAETVLEGLVAGILGVGITLLLCIPISAIIKSMFNVSNIAKLPFYGGIGLIFLSIALTVIAGIIPSRMAAKRDPAVALRTE